MKGRAPGVENNDYDKTLGCRGDDTRRAGRGATNQASCVEGGLFGGYVQGLHVVLFFRPDAVAARESTRAESFGGGGGGSSFRLETDGEDEVIRDGEMSEATK